MIYYQDGELTIRTRQERDAQVISSEQVLQGWHSTPEPFLEELRDHKAGKCVSLTAEYRGSIAGYINVYKGQREGPYTGTGYPEIVDFGVLEKYQRHGIGSRLMDVAEGIAAQFADTVCLGVGLHNGYGSAQRMYARRGYLPDGSGVWYRGKPCTPYDTVYTCDDDLLLYLSKSTPRRIVGETPVAPIRRATPADARAAAELAALLWPDAASAALAEEMKHLAAREDAAVYLYEKEGEAVGFAQCQLRHDYVEGAHTSPVGYLEGIYVREEERRKGIARALLLACEGWARARGCGEFASDCELDNAVSRQFHRSVGFDEANRIVAYVKRL